MMLKVRCSSKPIGDIRTRQPKSPGQKSFEWNRAPQTIPDTPTTVWANRTKNGDYRCTKCGHIGHPQA